MKKIVVLLTALLVGCTGAPAGGQSQSTAPQAGQTQGQTAVPWGDHVDAAQFAEKTKDPQAVIIDVRTPGEYGSGHLPGAKLIDVNDPSFTQKISELAKDGEYLVYCRSGNRSRTAISAMQQAGVTKVLGLEGGIGAWKGEIEK